MREIGRCCCAMNDGVRRPHFSSLWPKNASLNCVNGKEEQAMVYEAGWDFVIVQAFKGRCC